jgi:hypothetical protein
MVSILLNTTKPLDLIENLGPSSEPSWKGPTKPQTPSSHTPDTRRSASPGLEQLREASILSQIRKSVQIHKYTVTVHQFQKGPFFSQRDSFNVDEETDSDDGELDSDNDEDIPSLRDVARTRVEGSTKGA